MTANAVPVSAGEPVYFETQNYIVRTMTDADAGLGWGSWFANPDIAYNINARPRALSAAECQSYIARFDSNASHLIGIWRQLDSKLIGFWSIYVDPQRAEFYVNLVVGDTSAQQQGAREESNQVIYDYFFDQLHMKAVHCSVASTNPRMINFLLRRRWTRTTVAKKPAAAGDHQIEIHGFRLAREDWHARREPGWTEAVVRP